MTPAAPFLLCPLACAACLAAGCVPVAGDSIRAADLAGAAPVFAALDAQTPLAPAPQPGVRRVVGPLELAAWARRAGLALDPASPVCVERQTVRLEPARVQDALAQSLASVFGPDAALSWSMISFRPETVPPGELIFTRSGLSKAGAGLGADAHLWRGQLRYDDGRRSLPVVVTLRLARRRAITRAASGLAVQTRLEPGHLSAVSLDVSPLDPSRYADPARLEGRRLRRAVAAGQPVLERDLDPIYAVERGAEVVAEVTVGGAHIAVPAVAQTQASPGQRVLLRNPETKKTFAGRAVGAGRVAVHAGAAGLPVPRKEP